MSNQLRVLLTLIGLTPAACFDPMLDPGDDPGSGSDGSAADSSSSTTASGPDGTGSQADSTGPTDTPPVITAFTVDSSTMPSELQISSMVIFDVDATDDIGIDHIEIYDGDTLVTTVTEIPYRTELLLTSADNGSHSYSAIAYDAAGQTAESEVVPLSVNIVGGALLALREDIADVSMAAFLGAPQVAVDASGNVFATLTSPSSIGDDRHIQGLRYSSTLSLLWESSLSPRGSSAFAISEPTLTTEGIILVGGQEIDELDGNAMAIYLADAITGSPLSSLTLVPTGGDGVFPVTAQLDTGEVVLSIEPHVLQARTADLGRTTWTQEQFPGIPDSDQVIRGIVGIDVDDAGSSLITFTPSDAICGRDGQTCIRKLSPDGTTLWTRPAAGSDTALRAPTARFDGIGRAVTVWVNGDDGLSALVYDSDGMQVEDTQVLVGEGSLTSLALAIDPQGNLLVTGTLDDEVFTAWTSRITPSGDVLWSTLHDELEPGELGSVTSGVVVTSEGRAYITGVSAMHSPSLAALEGKAWIAEIGL